MKTKVVFVLGLIICIGSVFFGWKIYQNSTRTIVSIDDMQTLKLEKKDNALTLSGHIELGAFERISNWGAVQKEGIIYVYIMKTKALVKSDYLNIDLNDVILKDVDEEASEAYLVSGGEIEVKFKDNPQRNYIDVTNYSDKRKIL